MKARSNVRSARTVPQKEAFGPLVSVLMPVENGMPHIAEAIDSIAGQTLADWELVVVDNASTDGTESFIRRRVAEDVRITYYRNPNAGAADSLAAGLELCRGEWIAILEASDRALPNRLERQLAFMLQNRGASVASCLAYSINAEGERVPRIALDDAEENEDGELLAGVFARREALHSAHAFSSMGPILVQPEYLLEHRVDGDSRMTPLLGLGAENRHWAGEFVTARQPAWKQLLWFKRSARTPERVLSLEITASPPDSRGPSRRDCRTFADMLPLPGFTFLSFRNQGLGGFGPR